MITLIENDISLEEYLTLREKVGWKKLTDKQAAHALANCLYKVKAVDADGQVVGMGRVVGDGAVVCYIQDLIVIPQVQAQGIGSQIIQKLKAYVESLREEESTMMLCLMCAKGREPFYEKHGFMRSDDAPLHIRPRQRGRCDRERSQAGTGRWFPYMRYRVRRHNPCRL